MTVKNDQPAARGTKRMRAEPVDGGESGHAADLADALRRPENADANAMRFGAGSEEDAPDGSPDAAVRRAAAGGSGRDEEG